MNAQPFYSRLTDQTLNSPQALKVARELVDLLEIKTGIQRCEYLPLPRPSSFWRRLIESPRGVRIELKPWDDIEIVLVEKDHEEDYEETVVRIDLARLLAL